LKEPNIERYPAFFLSSVINVFFEPVLCHSLIPQTVASKVNHNVRTDHAGVAI
jgi:hypothetical protein